MEGTDLKLFNIIQMLFMLSFPAMGGSITRTIHYNPADADIQMENGWAVIEMAGFQQRGVPGTPLLPAVPEEHYFQRNPSGSD